MKLFLEVALSGPDLAAIGLAALERGFAGSGPPAELSVDGTSRKLRGEAPSVWLPQALGRCDQEIMVTWSDNAWLAIDRGLIVKAGRPAVELDMRDLARRIESIPFALCSVAAPHPWRSGAAGEEYDGTTFSDLHWSHGVCCAFRGAGHDRLVSRRWLEFGPWRLLRGADDTSLVQFCDLEADPRTQVAQARVGHERMGISDTGGFIQTDYVPAKELGGLYDPDKRQLQIVVHGREVPQVEMLDAAAARHYQVLGKDQPIASIAYVFMEEAPARRHLHELWLHGHECWALIKGVETRLDADYRPVPDPPEWVKAVEARESRS